MSEHFSLHYSLVENKDAILDLQLNFDNPTDELLVVRLNMWLKAIDRPNLLVSAIPVRKIKEEQPFVSTTKSVTTTIYNNSKRNDVIVIE
jgi:hypothetical protein